MTAERWARLLLRAYPAEWRARYGAEFIELLMADRADQAHTYPAEGTNRLGRRSPTLNVVAGGLRARLATTGLYGTTVVPADRARRSRAALGGALAVFAAFAVSMWSHLELAAQSARPDPTIERAIVVMTVAVVATLSALILGALSVIRAALHSGAARPSVLVLAGSAAAVVGGSVIHHGGGPAVPAVPYWAAVSATDSISAYWAHPSVLSTLPAGELAWMAVNAAVLLIGLVAAVRTLARVQLTGAALRWAGLAARVAGLGLALFLAGAVLWLGPGGSGTAAFRAGTVDLIGVAVTAAALGITTRAVGRAATTT